MSRSGVDSPIFRKLSNPALFTGVYKERHKDLRNRQLNRLRGKTAIVGDTNTVDNARRVDFHETLRPNLKFAVPTRNGRTASQTLLTSVSRRTYRGPVPGGPTPLLGLPDENADDFGLPDDITRLLSIDDSVVMTSEPHALDPEAKLQRVFLYYCNFGRSGVMRTERMGDWMFQKFVRECPKLLNPRANSDTSGKLTPKDVDLCFIKAIRGHPLDRLLRAWKCYDESMTPEIVKERAIKVLSGCTGKSVERLRAMAERELHILAQRNTDQSAPSLRTAGAHRLTFKTFLNTLAAISAIRYKGLDSAEAFAVLLRRNVFGNPVLTQAGPAHLRLAAARGANVPVEWSTQLVGGSADPLARMDESASAAGALSAAPRLNDGAVILKRRQRAITEAEAKLHAVRRRLERDVLGAAETANLYEAVVQNAPAFLTDVRKFVRELAESVMRVQSLRGALEQASRFSGLSRLELMQEIDRLKSELALAHAPTKRGGDALAVHSGRGGAGGGELATSSRAGAFAAQWQETAEQMQAQLEQTQRALERERSDAGAPRAMEPLSDAVR